MPKEDITETPTDTGDRPIPTQSLASKLNAGMIPERRDSPIAWYRARIRGWTREQFDHWVETGEEPNSKKLQRPKARHPVPDTEPLGDGNYWTPPSQRED